MISAPTFDAQWLTGALHGKWNRQTQQGAIVCPAHKGLVGREPNCSVRDGDKQSLLFHCFVGCSYHDIADALRSRGLWPTDDAFTPPVLTIPDDNGPFEIQSQNTPVKFDVVARYEYRDEQGDLLYYKEREEGIDQDGEKVRRFRQYQPDGTPGVRHLRRVLYKLPELLAAPPDALVWLCAGEKDADRLAGLGFIATTNRDGESSWDSSDNQYFAGRNVVILQDNDQAGHDRTAKLLRELQDYAKTLKPLLLPGLPHKGDVSDWLDMGHTADELLAQVATPPLKFLTPEQLDAMPSPEWLAEEWLPQGAFSCLYGPPGTGKSFVVLDLMFSVASGEDWLGCVPIAKSGFVVYIAAEGAGGLKERMRSWQAAHPKADISRVRFLPAAVNLMEPEQIDALVESIRLQCPEAPVLIGIDTLARSMAGGDENSTKDMSTVILAANTLQVRIGSHVMLVHHTGHNGDHGRGSSSLPGAVDTEISLAKEDSGIQMVCKKQKDGVAGESISLRLTPFSGTDSCVLEQFDPTGEITNTAMKILKVLANDFPLHEGASYTAWCDATGLPKTTFNRARTVLIKNRTVVRNKPRDPNMVSSLGCRDLGISPAPETPVVSGSTHPHLTVLGPIGPSYYGDDDDDD